MKNQNFDQQIKDSSILIVFHEHVTGGMAHILRDFLLEKSPKNLLFIAHPLLYIKESYQKSSYFEWYKSGKLHKKQESFHWQLPEQLLYIKDFFYTLFWILQTGTKFDLIVAIDPLNAIAALTLKLVDRTSKVVHYCIDYFPTRFQNPLMNRIYHLVDKIAVRFSDETWNLGARMTKARALGNNMTGSEYTKRQYHVPIGVLFTKIKRHPISKFNKTKLIYAGGFIDYMGIDMAIRALPQILKQIPNCTIDIIGRGDEETNWKSLAKQLKVDKHLHFEDWIQDRQKFHLRLSSAAIGLAPFNVDILDDKVKNADPGKIKDYTSSGLPVITTKAVYTWSDLEKSKCGLIINYNENDFAKAVIKLLKNPKILLEYRQNALTYASQFDWDKLYTQNLNRVLNR